MTCKKPGCSATPTTTSSYCIRHLKEIIDASDAYKAQQGDNCVMCGDPLEKVPYFYESEPCCTKCWKEISQQQLTKPFHPLINPESTHYQMIGGVEAIEEMEKMYSIEELMSWAKLSAMKYRLRIGNKDDPTKEIIKIKGFEAYYKYLEEKLDVSK